MAREGIGSFESPNTVMSQPRSEGRIFHLLQTNHRSLFTASYESVNPPCYYGFAKCLA